MKIQPALPDIEDPKIVKDIESYTVKDVTIFVIDLEKECRKTKKFKIFFGKLKAYSNYVCPVSKMRGYESNMKAKAGRFFQAMSALGSINISSIGGSVSDHFCIC